MGMHPTADTQALMFSKDAARRVMPGVMPLSIRKSREDASSWLRCSRSFSAPPSRLPLSVWRARPRRVSGGGVFAVGLIVTALVYVIFGLVGEAGAGRVALEGLGVVIYGAAAWAGLRGRHSLIAAGWALHVAWDVALHLGGAGAEYTPAWYPWGCVSFYLVIAGAVLMSVKRTT
jgi:hypothetical protein